ncbi:MAG: translocation/assembly module TamB domain-containing protein [Bacteroidales bacterium]|jgi:translocation and assembly module TamB|nr:translocation/assembly module TamB domain-containing protein [Bacteroidales bacterium]
MKILKKILKIIGWFILGVILLVVLILTLIQTPVVKKQIVRIAENQINNFLYAELSIGELTGNFFTHLELKNLLLTSEKKDTIAYIPEIKLKYELLPLLSGKIAVKEATIENPYVFLEQLNDSSWNFAHIAKPSESTDTTSSELNMLVEVDRFNLNNGTLLINAFDSIIPKEIKQLNINLSGHYSTNDLKANLENLSLITSQPDFEIQKLNLYATATDESVNLNSLLLKTRSNSIIAKGEYYFDKNKKSYIELETDPVIIEEFDIFLPPDFKLQPKPVIALKANMEAEKLTVDLKLSDNDQGVELQLLSHHLIEYFTDTVSVPVTYDIDLDIEKIDLRYWLNDQNLKYIVDGKLIAKGEGLDPSTMNSKVNGKFEDILVLDHPVSYLNLLLDYNAGNVKGNINGSGAFGYININPDLRQLLSDNPYYNLSLLTKKVDLSVFLGEEYKSDINLHAVLKGSGFDLNKISAESELEFSKSSAMGFEIDTLYGKIELIRKNIIVHSFFADALATHIEADGNYNLNGYSDINISAKIPDVGKIANIAGIDSIETSLSLNAHLAGQLDDMNANANIHMGKTKFKSILEADSLLIDATASVKNKNINANADLIADNLNISGYNLDEVKLKVETDTKDINLDLNINNPDIQSQINGIVSLGEIIKISLENLWLDYNGYNWQLASDTAHIEIGTNEYMVEKFNLVSDTTQFINIDGKINLNGEQNLKVEIKELNIAQLLENFNNDNIATGLLNLNIYLNGSAESPMIAGNIDIKNIDIQNYRLDLIKTAFSYRHKEAELKFAAIPTLEGNLYVEGKLPMEIRLDSMLFNVVPQNTDSVYARALIQQFPLSVLQTFIPLDEATGYAECDLTVNGTMKNPAILGNLNINNGIIRSELYGVNYRNIQTSVDIGTTSFEIDTFYIQSRTGNMQIKGGAQFASELYNAELKSSDVKILFNRFAPIDHKQYNMQLSGEIDLTANQDSLLFGGEMEIPEMQIYLPAIMALLGKASPQENIQPLLVVQMNKENLSSDSIVYTVKLDTTQNDTTNYLEFLNNLQGKLRVKIPRNTWIRNDDFRLELSGDVEIMKHKNFFELFGSIDVVRGQYNLLGKVFVIQTGIITFQGGEEINPILNIQAMYTFRDKNRNSRELVLNVTGEVSSPEISFTFEGQQISEGDAISYIIFGSSIDELASGQQQSLNSGMNAAGIAETVAASLISSQLSKFLGNTFNVDYIEFQSSSSFDNASFTVGKYITNKLFVSYQQTIGNIEDKDIARYEMAMEYELFKFLFLQLTSSSITNGFDIIFKFDSKTK